jgi:hypothetical protein
MLTNYEFTVQYPRRYTKNLLNSRTHFKLAKTANLIYHLKVRQENIESGKPFFAALCVHIATFELKNFRN